MFNRKGLFVVLIFSLIFISIIPLLMDWFVVGNNVPSNISNSDWVGFLGAYIGAIIGAIVSLIGIIVTISMQAIRIKEIVNCRLDHILIFCITIPINFHEHLRGWDILKLLLLIVKRFQKRLVRELYI